MYQANKAKKFTLIELLITIAIIAILAGMLLPALNSARERGRTTTCTSQLKQVEAAMSLYAGDYNGIMVFLCGDLYYADIFCGAEFVGKKYTRKARYLDWKNMVCPLLAAQGCPLQEEIGAVDAFKNSVKPWRYVSLYAGIKPSYSNSTKPMVDASRLGDGFMFSRSSVDEFYSPGKAKSPSTTFVHCDATYPGWSPNPPLYGAVWVRPQATVEGQPGPHNRHSGKTVAGFLDGHVKVLDAAELRNSATGLNIWYDSNGNKVWKGANNFWD